MIDNSTVPRAGKHLAHLHSFAKLALTFKFLVAGPIGTEVPALAESKQLSWTVRQSPAFLKNYERRTTKRRLKLPMPLSIQTSVLNAPTTGVIALSVIVAHNLNDTTAMKLN